MFSLWKQVEKKEKEGHAIESLIALWLAAKSRLNNDGLMCHSGLQAGTFWVKELGRGAGKGRGFSCLVGTARPLDCLSNCPCRMLSRNLWEGCGAGGVLHKQRQQRFSLHRGHGVGLTVPERSPCPDRVHEGGGIRGRPAGAHSLQLWSAAAQPNTRQHLQPSALKRPKKFRLGNTQPASC